MTSSPKHLKDYLLIVLEKNASDLHLAVGASPQIRIDGDLIPVGEEPLNRELCKKLCYEAMTPEQAKQFEKEWEIDLGIDCEGKARFRVNLSMERGNVTGAFRPIAVKIPTPEELGVPDVAMSLTSKPRGLVLVTGPTGSGKSTTLAAMINRINDTRSEHVITIEDPIEYWHPSKKCLVVQREVEHDTLSFSAALKRILRQDPDVVLVGEMRDIETIATAITVSETGHLVFATLHTNTAVQTINRIIDVFPPHQQPQIRTQLSFIIEGVLSQQLVPKIGGGRVLVMEIMFPTMAIRNLIRENKIHQIYAIMQTGQQKTGMQTMNQALAEMVRNKKITRESALGFATEVDEIERLLKG
ncbi:MAG: type IV pilus twitching motility protein PilT [Deltaproteobacteria bacterium]|nr:type IV pilus twitching motility protein PilT [Deltaproteobacteria bacterium]